MKLNKKNKAFNTWTEFYTHDSSVIGLPMNFSVIRPGNPNGISLIWLSGLTCTEENFVAKAGAQRLCSELGITIICPDTSPRETDYPGQDDCYDFGTGAGFYLDATETPWSESYKMESYLISEFLPMVIDQFQLNKDEVKLSGHSMGGHGALTLGLKNPELFSSLSAFSPIVNPMECPWGQKAFSGYLGNNREAWKEYDACHLVRTRGYEGSITVFQGTEDEFLERELLTENFVSACDRHNIDLTLHQCYGYDHSYYFISTFLEPVLRA